jgi:hypothetical protein
MGLNENKNKPLKMSLSSKAGEPASSSTSLPETKAKDRRAKQELSPPVEEAQEASPEMTAVINRADGNVDRRNIKPKQKEITTQRSYTLTISNLRRMEILGERSGATKNWIVNKALEDYFKQEHPEIQIEPVFLEGMGK